MTASAPMIPVYAPPSALPPAAPRPVSWRYNRSSFEGDFLVVIPNQTAEDFEQCAPESQFCEYFRGVVYMPSPVADRHQEITSFLDHMLDAFRLRRGTGRVLTGPAVLRMDEELKPEPDLFVRPTADQAAEGGPFAGAAAVLVIEVLSPSNRPYDLDFKAAFYHEVGIPEIWYVDDRDKVLFVDRRIGVEYRRDRIESGIIEPGGIPGFRLEVGWLWQDPLPDWLELLEALLA